MGFRWQFRRRAQAAHGLPLPWRRIAALGCLLAIAVPAAQAGGAPAAPVRYDDEYPAINYSGPARHNSIARLQQRLERGEARLEYRPPRGYLDSILRELGMDPSSQVLVFSKTSLQFQAISGEHPRALYFNDDAFVGWIRGSDLLEFAAMDAQKGLVFYSLWNLPGGTPVPERETHRCLTCHDTFSMAGGGVPKFMVNSSLVNRNGAQLTDRVSAQVTDRTPIRDRWGGWYVTGELGRQQHLGNLQPEAATPGQHFDLTRTASLRSVAGLFDTQSYLTDQSDVVALLVLEHQATVYNAITRLNFKARTILAREGLGLPEPGRSPKSWEEMSPRDTRSLRAMAEPVVAALLFADAAPLDDAVGSGSGFDRWFAARGPRDSKGRSLRDFDLKRRLFRYPLSYVIHSEAFDALPAFALDQIYRRLAEILTGRDTGPAWAHLDAEGRRAALEILLDTKPAFRPYAAR